MSRAKVKEIKVTIGATDGDMSDMFAQMLGAGTVNIHIAYPRYTTMKGIVDQLIKLFEVLAASPLMESFHEERLELVTFCREARAQMATVFSMDLTADYGWDISTVEPALCKRFSDVYTAMKKAPIVNTFIVMCDRLVEYKRHFADLNALSYNFINNMSGVEWSPLPFTRMNLKNVMALNIGDGAKMFIMTVLSRAFTLSHSLYTELQAPDIDVDQFVDFIMKNIDRVQKHPELARCGDAFKKIRESVRMLRERFNGYYRDFIDTQDNTIIMQHFILDVSKAGTASAKVAGQFRTIIGFYQKVANQRGSTDPRMKSLFERLNASFKSMDSDTLNLVKSDGCDANADDADAGDTDSVPIAAPVAVRSGQSSS